MLLNELTSLAATPLNQFFEGSNQVFWICSADLKQMFYMSSAYHSIWCRENLNLDKCLQDFVNSIYNEDKTRIMSAFGELFTSGEIDEEYRIVLPDSSLKWIRTHVFPVIDTVDETEYIAGIAEEITEYKQMQVQLNQSEEIFRQFANHAEVVFWVCKPDVSKFHYISPGYEKIWGRSCESLFTDPQSFLDLVHPDDLERLREAAFGENSCSMDEEYRIVKPDGNLRWMRDITFPIYDEKGNIYRMAGISCDVTVRKQAEIESIRALQRERELSEAKSNLISIISHQIRTPLTAIQSSCDILEHYLDRLTEEKKRSHFQKIGTAIEQVTDIVQDVLMLSELNANALSLNKSRVEIIELCSDAIANVSDNHRIEFVSSVKNQHILVDRKLVRYIIINLLENALKYSDVSQKVKFNLDIKSDYLSFYIEDKGIGISSKNIEKIFDSFYRGGNVGNIQGTGLGLSIVKQCVELHQGKILVSSALDQGTIFTVIIPQYN